MTTTAIKPITYRLLNITDTIGLEAVGNVHCNNKKPYNIQLVMMSINYGYVSFFLAIYCKVNPVISFNESLLEVIDMCTYNWQIIYLDYIATTQPFHMYSYLTFCQRVFPYSYKTSLFLHSFFHSQINSNTLLYTKS